jgi:hypothetical protein
MNIVTFIVRGQQKYTCLIFIRKTYVTFEVLTAVTMKNAVFWDVTPCGSFFATCVGC